jgi:hypothetical protein
MIRIGRRHLSQQIRINAMLLIAPTQVRTRADAHDAHLLHVPLHGFAVDYLPFSAQLRRYPP